MAEAYSDKLPKDKMKTEQFFTCHSAIAEVPCQQQANQEKKWTSKSPRIYKGKIRKGKYVNFDNFHIK